MAGLGLTGSLHMGTRALHTQRLGVEITGHNLSNVNTPGASRQRVDISTDIALNLASGQQGTGSYVRSIESIRSDLLDQQVVQNKNLQGHYDSREELEKMVEDLIGEDLLASATSSSSGIARSVGIQSKLNALFDSFQELASNPTSEVARTQVLSRAESIAGEFRSVNQRLLDAQASIATEAGAIASEVNQITTQIGDLNQEIFRVEVASQSTANDLRDRRQLLVENLAQLVNITATEQTNGNLNITLEDVSGVVLVQGPDGGGSGSTESLSVAYNAATNPSVVISASTTGALAAGLPSGGSLGAHAHVANVVIGSEASVGNAGLLGDIDQVALSLVSLVNTQHALGSDLNNNAGADFFTAATTGAGDLSVAAAISADTDLIAAGDGSGPLSGSNAIALSDLRDNVNLLQRHQDIVTDLGLRVQETINTAEAQRLITEHAIEQRESVSGISVDEEMSNLVIYQRAYEASARFVSTIDEMIDRVVNRMGAGRG